MKNGFLNFMVDSISGKMLGLRKGQSIWYKKDKNDNSCYSGSFLLKLDIWQQIYFMVKKVLMS